MASLQVNESEPESQASLIILLTSMGHGLCHIAELAYAAVIPAVMAEFAITADKAALLAVPGFVLFGVGAVPTGLWADRRGPLEAMRAYFALVAVACLAVFFSGSPWSLGVGLTLLGAAISVYHPAGLAMLSRGCRRRGRAMGINGVCGSLGVATGPALGIFIVSTFSSWRLTYAVIAGLSVIGFIFSTLVRIDLPAIPARSGDAKDPRTVNSLAVLAILFAAMLVGGFNYRCMTTALPTFISQRTAGAVVADDRSTGAWNPPTSQARSGSAGKSSLVVFLVFAFGGIGQLGGGLLADRFRPAVLYCIMIGASVPLALLIDRASGRMGLVATGVFTIFVFAQQPLENTMIAEATPARWRSTVYGLKFILAFGIASVGIYIAGLVWRYHGLARVFDVYAGGATLMATLAVVYTCSSLRRHEPQ